MNAHSLLRCVWLSLLALAELTWLAIRIEAPSTGLLSYAKGLPSILTTSLAVVIILARARSYGNARYSAFVHDAPRSSWSMVLMQLAASADFYKLASVHFTWLSFVVSSVLFGALHGRWLAGTIAGMCYAFAMYRRGKLTDAIIAHATTNALIAAMLWFAQIYTRNRIRWPVALAFVELGKTLEGTFNVS